jgi:putative addiction module antidote
VVVKIAVRRAGGSVTATLPKNVVERLRIAPGDNLFLVETEQGVLLTPYDPNFDRAMQIYERGAKQYRNALHELAK